MAKKQIKKEVTQNPAEEKKLSREEVMKVPGWSNVQPGSPQTKPVSRKTEV
jgi:hypothetical protein